jgi:hypothetical protein
MYAFLGSLPLFCLLDVLLTRVGVQGAYYAIHAFHNACIVYLTTGEVIHTLLDFNSIQTQPVNYTALELVFALHLYHILMYWNKFRFDDWLHHILMIGVALPIGGLVPAGSLLGYSLFFTTGLPGGIDYGLLFLVRNLLIDKETQKRVNSRLAIWIRSPGCISLATFALAHISVHPEASIMFVLGCYVVAFLNYWNGQYFMAQVVYDAGKNQVFEVKNYIL